MSGIGEEIDGAMQHAPQPERQGKEGEITVIRLIIADSTDRHPQARSSRIPFRMTTMTDNSWINIPPAM